MAERDPNAIVSEGWIDKKADFEGLKIPDAVDKNKLGTEYYAYQRTYKNGRRVIEWYKRGSGGGAPGPDGKPGDSVLTTAEDVVPVIKEAWDKEAEKDQKDAAPPGGVPTKTINGKVFRWNPETRAYDIPTDEALAPSAPSQAAAPGGKPFIDDGPEAGASGRRWGWNPETRLYDRDLGPSPAAQKPVEAAKPRQSRINPSDPTKMQEFDPTAAGGQGAWVDAGINQAEVERRKKAEEADAEKNRPKPQQDEAGNWGYWDTSKTPPAWVPIQGQTPVGKPQVPTQVNGVWGVWRPDPKDPKAPPTFEPVENQPGQMPAGVPQYTPDLTKPGAGLIDYAKSLDEWMAANPGKLTWEKRQQLVESAVKMGGQIASEFNSAATMLREDYQQRASQRGQDVQQANARATLANTHYQNAVGLVEKFAPYLGVTPGDAGKLFMGMMASQLATATMYGGMKDVPREDMNPQLRGWAEQTVGRSLAPTGAAIPPGPGEAAGPAVDPQAAEKAKSAAMAEAQRASGQPMPTPLLGPQPVTAPVQPATAPAPAQINPALVNTDPYDGAGYPVNPLPGEPGNSPNMPVGMGLPQPMAGGSPAVGEALFGKSLPEPSSWRQDAEDRMYALTMPQQGAYGAGSGLFGASLPPALTQPSGGIDYGLSMPQGGGGMDAIDAEARRQLREAGVLV